MEAESTTAALPPRGLLPGSPAQSYCDSCKLPLGAERVVIERYTANNCAQASFHEACLQMDPDEFLPTLTRGAA